MESVRGRFRARAADDLGAMTAARASGERHSLRERAHRLAGVAATFGYPAIGDAARLLDDLIDQGALDEDTDAAAERLFELLVNVAASPR
jgi:HPt (histidine-containing phosphotransfer) domain-containing protein